MVNLIKSLNSTFHDSKKKHSPLKGVLSSLKSILDVVSCDLFIGLAESCV